MIVVQQAAEPFATFNRARDHADFFGWLNDSVFESLMVSFLVIMGQEFGAGVSQRPCTEEDQLVKTLRFQAEVKSLQMGIQIRTSWWQTHRFDIPWGQKTDPRLSLRGTR